MRYGSACLDGRNFRLFLPSTKLHKREMFKPPIITGCPAYAMQATKGRGDITPKWRVSSQRHASAVLYLRGRTLGTHYTGVWVGLRAGLDTKAKGKILCLCQGSNPGRPFCSQALLPTELPQLPFNTDIMDK
jgi:hypothetical protein